MNIIDLDKERGKRGGKYLSLAEYAKINSRNVAVKKVLSTSFGRSTPQKPTKTREDFIDIIF
jgi:hypothetical protein